VDLKREFKGKTSRSYFFEFKIYFVKKQKGLASTICDQ